MQCKNRWIIVAVLMIFAGLQLFSACTRASARSSTEIDPVQVEPVPGTDFKRVVLSERAAQRLDIQTVPVREEEIVRTRTVGGEVVAFPEAQAEQIPHRIEFTVTDLTKVIAGVRTVVVWVVDYSDGEVVEQEIAFYAQDNDGNVWYLGEYPEEYEDGELADAPTWIAGIEGARPGIKMQTNPQPGTPAYFQGWGPAVEWTDYGQVDQIGQATCVLLDCYNDVLVIAESSLDEPGAFQLKYYARGVGLVRVGWRGEDASQEELELVELTELDPQTLAKVRADALKLEKHAYEISKDVYAQTSPAERTPGPGSSGGESVSGEPLPEPAIEGEAAQIEFASFDPQNFNDPTNIDNEWLPLKPGTQWAYEGFTIESGPDPDLVWVRLSLTESERNEVDRSQPARVLPFGADNETAGWTAQPDEGPGVDEPEDAGEAMYYLVDDTAHDLTAGQPVLIELPLAGSRTQRKIVPYTAVIYGLHGETWVYTNPEPLVFVRHPIGIEYIEGDLAALSEGPPPGTQVVVVGVAELYGAETGVSK